MQKPDPIQEFWQNFTKSEKLDPALHKYNAWHFCNDEISANKLAQLVVEGTKTATAGLLWSYVAEGEKIPEAGDYSVITRWDKTPVCVIQTLEVTVTPFNAVSPEFAYDEGEGDRSLQYWRKVHWEFFSEECSAINKTPDETMLVVCERFRVIFKNRLSL